MKARKYLWGFILCIMLITSLAFTIGLTNYSYAGQVTYPIKDGIEAIYDTSTQKLEVYSLDPSDEFCYLKGNDLR